MSYASVEASVHGGAPVEFYRFTHALSVYTFCSGDEDIAYNTETYRSIQVERPEIEISDEQARVQLEITIPRDNPVPLLFVAGPPGAVVGLTVFRKHRDDAEVVTVWKGRVSAVEWSGLTAKLTCEPIFSALTRPMLRAMYQRMCRHALYDEGCTINRETFVDTATLASVTGDQVVLATSSRASGWFTGGYIQRANGQRRMVRNHVGLTLTLLSPVPGLAPGEAVFVYAGCDHSQATCASKFSNADNYGGFPYIPSKNPFGGGGIL
jgi:uncharacterized phage protein (TIGR02218 family)